jgi:hypothetical protein
MQRLSLSSKCPSVIPDRQTLAADSNGVIRLPIPKECVWPLWIELTPSHLGFPAATTRISVAATERWQLPPLSGLEFLEMFYLQLVDDIGQELCSYHVQRTW